MQGGKSEHSPVCVPIDFKLSMSSGIAPTIQTPCIHADPVTCHTPVPKIYPDLDVGN